MATGPDVIVSFDSAGSTTGSGIKIEEEIFYVPKVNGITPDNGPDPVIPTTDHYLTIEDYTGYRDYDQNIILTGTRCADTTHFKIILNLPTGVVQSGAEIVRAFVVYETGKTNEKYMVLPKNDTSDVWVMTIPIDAGDCNCLFDKHVTCTHAYLTICNTANDGIFYGDEAIFDWIVNPTPPAIKIGNAIDLNAFGLSGIVGTDRFIEIHCPNAIIGDTIIFNNVTDNVTDTIVVTEEMMTYNSAITSLTEAGSSLSNQSSETYKYVYGSKNFGAVWKLNYSFVEWKEYSFTAQVHRLVDYVDYTTNLGYRHVSKVTNFDPSRVQKPLNPEKEMNTLISNTSYADYQYYRPINCMNKPIINIKTREVLSPTDYVYNLLYINMIYPLKDDLYFVVCHLYQDNKYNRFAIFTIAKKTIQSFDFTDSILCCPNTGSLF